MARFPSHPPLLNLLISANAGSVQKQTVGTRSRLLSISSPLKKCIWELQYHPSMWMLAAEDACLYDQIVSPSEQAGMDLQNKAEGG